MTEGVFSFVGTLPASKSLMNRALICQSYFSEIDIQGNSLCDDVVLMKNALSAFQSEQKEFNCGQAGTVLRFLALRVAREPGEYLLKGKASLMKRLPEQLLSVLRQLGSEVSFNESGLKIKSPGWKVQGDALHIPSESTSQIASAIFLNSWQLEKPLHVSLSAPIVSSSYFEMTCQVLQNLGLHWVKDNREFIISPNQVSCLKEIRMEMDLSSAFSVAATAALMGEARLLSFPEQSLQPDQIGFEFLARMGAQVTSEGSCLRISKAEELKPLVVHVGQCPDLFPVLSILAAFAHGRSHFFGAPHLKDKESDRIHEVEILLKKCGLKVQKDQEGLEVWGPLDLNHIQPFSYSAHEDHRMAMAAGLLKKAGVPVEVLGAESVKKSFPEFWNILGMS